MITKENIPEKICSFYASDYHLEMIMIPYINKKIENNAKVVIMTERNLKETVETVISKVNLDEARKREILNIGWERNDLEKIEQIKNTNKEKELIVFIIGNADYMNDINESVFRCVENRDAKIIDCYSLEDAGENITNIIVNHSKVLNTTEEKELS